MSMLITVAAFFFAIPVLIAQIIVMQFDDALSRESRQLYASLDAAGSSEAYLYLLGILAAETDDPIEVGQYLLAEYRKQEIDQSYQVREYSHPGMLELPAGEVFCNLSEEGCVQAVFADINLTELLNEHSVLIARVDRFHEFDEYKTLTKPLLSEIYPPFRSVVTVERIKVLQAIEAHRGGFSERAVSLLEERIPTLRKGLSQQDTLIGKLVYLNLLSQALDVLSIVSTEAGERTKRMEKLGLAEMNFGVVAAREFYSAADASQQIFHSPELSGIDIPVPRWVFRMLYKPNMTINAFAPLHHRFASDLLLTPAQFAQRVENVEEQSIEIQSSRNPLGQLLVGLHGGYDEYVARFMDFQAKVVLFNHLEIGFDAARNPYYEGEAPKMHEDEVCFRGPLESRRSLRCLLTNRPAN